MTSMLCNLVKSNQRKHLREKYKSIDFKFAVIVSSGKSSLKQLESYFDSSQSLPIPTLHMYGNSDKIVPSERSIELTGYFEKPMIFNHEYGHCIPYTNEARESYSDFFKQMSSEFKTTNIIDND